MKDRILNKIDAANNSLISCDYDKCKENLLEADRDLTGCGDAEFKAVHSGLIAMKLMNVHELTSDMEKAKEIGSQSLDKIGSDSNMENEMKLNILLNLIRIAILEGNLFEAKLRMNEASDIISSLDENIIVSGKYSITYALYEARIEYDCGNKMKAVEIINRIDNKDFDKLKDRHERRILRIKYLVNKFNYFSSFPLEYGKETKSLLKEINELIEYLNTNEKQLIADIHRVIGLHHFNEGDIKNSLSEFEKASQIYVSLNHEFGVVKTILEMHPVLIELNDYEYAEHCLRESEFKLMGMKFNKFSIEFDIFMKRGELRTIQGQYKIAYRNLMKAYIMLMDAKKKYGYIDHLSEAKLQRYLAWTGWLSDSESDFEKVKQRFEESIRLYVNEQHKVCAALTTLYYVLILIENGKYENLDSQIERAKNILNTNEFRVGLKECCNVNYAEGKFQLLVKEDFNNAMNLFDKCERDIEKHNAYDKGVWINYQLAHCYKRKDNQKYRNEVIKHFKKSLYYAEKIGLEEWAQKVTEDFIAEASNSEKQEMIINRYIGRKIAGKLMEDDNLIRPLKANRKLYTIFFADICGFTSLCEEVSDSAMIIDILNPLLKQQARIIENKFGGSIDKYIGDAVMVLFEHRDKSDLTACKSVECAIELMKNINIFSDSKRDELGKRHYPLSLSIGITTGSVIPANVGSLSKMNYTVIGKTVNLAARLQDFAERGQILVDRETYNMICKLKHDFEMKHLETTRLKGILTDINCYEITYNS